MMPDELVPIASIEEAIAALNTETTRRLLMEREFQERIEFLHQQIGRLLEENQSLRGQLSQLQRDRDYDAG